jgi:hypothetical protein
MFKNPGLALVVAGWLSIMLILVGCGGVGAAPISVGSLAGVAVSVSPQSMTIDTGTTQPFTASVSNSSETSVGWLVNGFPGGINPSDGSSPFGTIDKDGNYTAPPFIPVPPNVTVTAVASADNSATANASVSIKGTRSPVSISPTSASVQVGDIILFTGTAGAGQPVNWLVENILGGNAVLGTTSPVPGSTDQVTYTAPLAVPGGGQSGQVHVTVQSVANPQETASAVVTISAARGGAVVTIISPPSPPTVQLGQTQPFQARVVGVSDTTVSWEVDAIPGGDAGVGTIATGPHDTALYTPPALLPAPPTVTVTAVSNAQPSAQASILVNLIAAQPATVTLTPDICANTDAVPVTTQVNFTAEVSGPQDQDVTWQVNKVTGGNATVGTIAQVGTTHEAVYTAPANVPSPAIVTVAAVSVANPLASATVPLTISATAAPKVLISPTSGNAYATGQGVDFTATVVGMGDSTVAENWAVNGELGGDDTIGTVGPTVDKQPSGCVAFGSYYPPATVPNPNQVSVTAATADGLTSPAAVVTILPPPLTITLIPGSGDPQAVEVQPPNNTVQYTATDSDTSDTINWTLTSSGQDCSVTGGSICGTLNPTGGSNGTFTATYTAPTTVPPNPNVTVTANSVADPSAPQNDNYNDVTISNVPPSIAINGPTTVPAGTGPYDYTAIIQGGNPNSIVWQLGCISDWDGVSSTGNCEPTRQDDYKDGPGCIKYGRAKVCGAAGDLTVPAQSPLSYTPPLAVSTTDYLQNACTLNGDPHASIVPLNVSMQANGCPGNPPTCTALACITVTPP